jgi:flagellar hook-length control protein FliK
MLQSNEKPVVETPGVVAEVTSPSGGEQVRVDRSALGKFMRKPTTEKDETPMPPASPTPPATVNDAAVKARQVETASIARIPEPLRLIVMTVRGAMGRGEHEVRLQLQPESLGRVEARLSYGDGEVQIHLAADSAQTGALLQSHASDLRAALAGAGVAVGRLDVTVSDGRSQSRQPFFEREESTARREAIPPSAPLNVAAVKSSKLDCRV